MSKKKTDELQEFLVKEKTETAMLLALEILVRTRRNTQHRYDMIYDVMYPLLTQTSNPHVHVRTNTHHV